MRLLVSYFFDRGANAKSIGKKMKTNGLKFFVSFFSCDQRTPKHLAKASCTELTKLSN